MPPRNHSTDDGKCYHADGTYCPPEKHSWCFYQHYREPWLDGPHGPVLAQTVTPAQRLMTSGELNALVVKRNICGYTETDERKWELEQDVWWNALLDCSRQGVKYLWHDGEEVLV